LDCDSVLEVDSRNVKALLRKAEALGLLGRHAEEVPVLEQCLGIQPQNAEARAALERVQGVCGGEEGTGSGAPRDAQASQKGEEEVG
jgi:hypothetical protein